MSIAPHSYIPQPLDTSDVVLPQRLQDIVEQMARNVHETWAAGRMAQGWTWGTVRNDERREHPCLVAYDELTEDEKDYDRRTVEATLKAMVKLCGRQPITEII